MSFDSCAERTFFPLDTNTLAGGASAATGAETRKAKAKSKQAKSTTVAMGCGIGLDHLSETVPVTHGQNKEASDDKQGCQKRGGQCYRPHRRPAPVSLSRGSEGSGSGSNK